jgi:hypothetical protein
MSRDLVFQKVWTSLGDPKLLVIDRPPGNVLATLDDYLVKKLNKEWKTKLEVQNISSDEGKASPGSAIEGNAGKSLKPSEISQTNLPPIHFIVKEGSEKQ